MANVDCEFPINCLLPKKETGILNFLTKYPEYDGRNVVIAILDSGVDPNAAGLQVTSDGKPKVIERYDCSGAGDIDMSTIVKPLNGEIKGLSGRTLKIPNAWKNPSGEYRIGLRNCYDLLNKSLKDSVRKRRKEKLWDKSHKIVSSKCAKYLQTFSKELEGKELCREDKLKKEELESQVDVLHTLEEKYADAGPVYDFVSFHDGTQWWAVMDTSEKGDLNSCSLLTEFSIDARSYSTFSAEIPFTYSFNVHDGGNILEIVGCASSHGTHVAAIAAAYFPEDPSKNGIAPGAQIISLTIGDNRLGTMETGTAISRAMIRMMNRCGANKKVHVINMSYGEMSHFNSSGRLGDMMNDVVDKYGIVWIASAGNSGPALFTISTPPDISSNNIIGVGAYVSADMMAADYSLRETMPGTLYSWSSRGPTMDGDAGITVCAPGGAFTSVPNYTLKHSEFMNGTSMAAPHVTGAVACLISGLMQRGISYSPYFIKRTLQNTASFHESLDYFAQGCGLLQVEKAFDHLVSYHNEIECNVRFHVTCSPSAGKGIVVHSNKVTDCNVTIEPVFLKKDEAEAKVKLQFNMNLIITTNATWVQIPKYLAITNASRTICVRIDPTNLAVGAAHAATIFAYDSANVDKGAVFRVQITVIKPQILDTAGDEKPMLQFKQITFAANTIRRHFIKVPEQVTWAIVNVDTINGSKEKNGKFMLHCLQTRPKKSCETYAFKKMFTMLDKNEIPLVFAVKGGLVLEVTLAKFWSSLGEMALDYSIEFGGNRPCKTAFTMQHAAGLYRISLHASLKTEEIQFKAKLKNNVVVLKPTDSSIIPLDSERDVIPPSTVIYQLTLTYNLHVNKTAEFVITSPILADYLYESDYESQLWMLYDNNKRYITSGDAYPDQYGVKLEKGDYVIRHQVRHDRKDLLEKLCDMYVLLSQKLVNSISLDAYTSYNNATLGKKMKSLTLTKRDPQEYPLFIAPVSNDKLPKSISIGQYLQGVIVFSKDSLGKKVDTYPIKYILADVPKKNVKSTELPPTKSKQDEFQDAYREFMTSWITKYDADDQAAQSLYEKLTRKMKDHLPIHTAMLQNLEPENKRYLPGSHKDAPTRAYLLRVISIADTVIERVDQVELLAYLGTKTDQQAADISTKIKSKFAQQKAALLEAMGRKGCAMCQLYLLHNDAEKESEENKVKLEDIDSLWLNLLKFVDAGDVKETYYFNVWHAAAFSHYGRLAKILYKLAEDKNSYDIDFSLRWSFGKLNWQHCHQQYGDRLLVHYPAQYQLF